MTPGALPTTTEANPGRATGTTPMPLHHTSTDDYRLLRICKQVRGSGAMIWGSERSDALFTTTRRGP